jgi:diguanylate cyclase (GGDEF)-like protein/PAS domain S-box-containing protein
VQDITDQQRTEAKIQLREAALEAAANAIVITDAEGNIQWANPAFTRLSGYGLDELQGENPRLLKSGKEDLAFYQALWAAIASGEVWRGEVVNKRKNGTLYHEEKTITPVRDTYGALTHFVAVGIDISERKWTEEALESLVESMVGVTGMAYLQQVARSLCEWFQVDGACIGEMFDGERIRAVSMVVDGQARNGYEYLLCGTPCANVLSQGPLLCEQQAAALFPDDFQLVKLGIQGYAGVPLEDVGGHARGILWIISRAPMRLPSHWQGVLQIVAAKAAAEIARLHAEEALRSKSAYLDGILMSSFNMAVVATDVDYRVRYYNPAAERIMGMRADEVLGVTIMDIHERERVDPERFARGMQMVDREGQYRYTVERTIGGEPHFVEARMSRIWRSDGTASGYVLTAEDVTQRRKDAELLEHQANFDSLTDLPNRRLLIERLNQAIAQRRRHQRLGAVLFLDLDHFKDINDSLGHLLGDKLLQDLAERLGRGRRQEDLVARLGGDEFVVLLQDVGGSEEPASRSAQLGAQKILDLVSTPFLVEGHRIHITTSIGIALFPTHGADAHAVIKSADTAMYRAKAKGRNTYRFFSVDMQERAERRFRRQASLREATEKEQLCLHYQAQVDSRGDAVGVEALLRWNHPERGLIGPDELIRTAEETGQIVPIGEWVLRLALDELRRWKQRVPDLALRSVSVNLSPIQFRQRDFAERAEGIILGSGLSPDHLVLELTESVLLDDFDKTVDQILRLKGLGVRFSLDDFGTGYSSLSYLRHLPVDVIKIDKSFIDEICDDAHDAKLVATILSLAETLGKAVVAEGVETRAQRDLLLGWGCHFFQGYYFHRPEASEHFLARLVKRGLPLSDALSS